MPPILPGSADASNNFEDLSGIDSTKFSNPYEALIEACQNDPVRLVNLMFTFPTSIHLRKPAFSLASFRGQQLMYAERNPIPLLNPSYHTQCKAESRIAQS
jgi:hypothetical protein